MLFAIFKLVITLSLVFANNDCLLDHSNLNGALDLNSPKVKEKIPGKLVEYHFVESVVLSSDWKVTFREGGCAHFGMVFTFEKNQFSFPKAKKLRLKFVDRLLEETPVLDRDVVRIFRKAIKRASSTKEQFENGILELPCGDAFCQVDVSDPKVIKLAYDFPL